MLRSENIFLRSVEATDATRIMLWENNPAHWKVTDTEVPFSMTGIMQLIEQQQHFRSTGQLRLMICLTSNEEAIGTIDLYDADFKNGNAAVGILIGEDSEEERAMPEKVCNCSLLMRAIFWLCITCIALFRQTMWKASNCLKKQVFRR